jgi:peptidoglycan DL-endopeptidase CwlO
VAFPAVRPRRPLSVLLLALLATVAVLFTSPSVVYATPSPGAIEDQIDQKWNQLEPIIEKYNAVHQQLLDGQAQVAKLQAQIQPLKTQVDLAMTRVGALSAQLYELGPSAKLNAMLTSDDPTTFVDQLGTLNAIATMQTANVADAIKLKNQFDEQEKPIDDQVAQLKVQNDQLNAQKADIQKQIDDLQKLRLTAYGSGGGTGNLRPVACPQVYDGSPGAKAAQFACNQIAKPYVWGADGPGSYDCSGLTMAAWKSVGVSLPHNAYQQKQVTTRITKDQLRPGDLIFMYSDVHHVVIYVGNGWDVAAPTTGEDVQMQKPFDDPGRINSYGRPKY